MSSPFGRFASPSTRTPRRDTFTDVQMLRVEHEAGHLSAMFRLLGDPTRVRILYSLLEAGELCVHDIAVEVGTSETKVSQALRLLRGAGVVRNRRDGRNIFYRLDDDHIRMLLEVSLDHLAHRDGPG
jgi:DNA-binding transcriptional ArsR family regulator